MKEQEGCLGQIGVGTVSLVIPGMAPAIPGERNMEFHVIIVL